MDRLPTSDDVLTLIPGRPGYRILVTDFSPLRWRYIPVDPQLPTLEGALGEPTREVLDDKNIS